VTELLKAAANNRTTVSSNLQPLSVEFTVFPRANAPLVDPVWVGFRKRFEGAAVAAGFQKRLAQGMTAAFGEMADNVIQHSEDVVSGIAGYRWTREEFEYVVADSGIGVLASLRTCPDYSDIADDGRALSTALTPGESRHGKGSGHGTGFKQVFTSLMNHFGKLRFRSGDFSASLDGQSPGLETAQLAQCPPYYQGFLVSVLCRTACL
jgi:hypothetical protein